MTVSSPVSRGDTATAHATVVHDADCTIRVIYGSGTSTAHGLEPKSADGAGNVSWAWTIETNAVPGTWPVEVSCSTPSGQRAVAQKTLTIR